MPLLLIALLGGAGFYAYGRKEHMWKETVDQWIDRDIQNGAMPMTSAMRKIIRKYYDAGKDVNQADLNGALTYLGQYKYTNTALALVGSSGRLAGSSTAVTAKNLPSAVRAIKQRGLKK